MATKKKTTTAKTKKKATTTTRTKAQDVLTNSHKFIDDEIEFWKGHLKDIKDVNLNILGNKLGAQDILTEFTALAVNYYDLTFGWMLRAPTSYGGGRSSVAGSGKTAKKSAKKP